MDFLAGQAAWRDRSVGKGSVTYAGGRLYACSEQVKAALAEATLEAYKQVSNFRMPPGEFNTWTPPVIANGKLYPREQDNLYCFDIQAKP